jgi:hypothetical protein
MKIDLDHRILRAGPERTDAYLREQIGLLRERERTLLLRAGQAARDRLPGARFAAPALAQAQDPIGLTEPLRLGHEGFGGRRRVEGEQVVMAGDDEPRPDLVGEPCRFAAVEVAGDAALGRAAVDREQGDVDPMGPQALGHAVVEHGVAAVVQRPRPHPDDVAEEAVPPASSRSIASCAAAIPVIVQSPTSTLSPSSRPIGCDGSIPSRSEANARFASGAPARGGIDPQQRAEVSASRWSVWLWLEVTT